MDFERVGVQGTALVAVIASVASCAGSRGPPDAMLPDLAPAASSAAMAPPDVAIEVRGPSHVRYDASLLGPSRPLLRIAVTNRSLQDLDVSDLHLHVRVEREGVAFRCEDESGGSSDIRETKTLPPGRTALFDRTLDCALPLAGVYTVRMDVSFGTGEAAMARSVEALTLTITALSDSSPRELVGHSGIWAAVGAGGLIPIAGGGHGRIAFAVVNATATPQKLPHLRLALRVYRRGTATPCEDEPMSLRLPEELPPGTAHQVPLDVSCLGLGAPGSYEVVARVLDETGGETTVGRLRIEVASGPATLMQPNWLPPR
jgi:hypothetical protein